MYDPSQLVFLLALKSAFAGCTTFANFSINRLYSATERVSFCSALHFSSIKGMFSRICKMTNASLALRMILALKEYSLALKYADFTASMHFNLLSISMLIRS